MEESSPSNNFKTQNLLKWSLCVFNCVSKICKNPPEPQKPFLVRERKPGFELEWEYPAKEKSWWYCIVWMLAQKTRHCIWRTIQTLVAVKISHVGWWDDKEKWIDNWETNRLIMASKELVHLPNDYLKMDFLWGCDTYKTYKRKKEGWK